MKKVILGLIVFAILFLPSLVLAEEPPAPKWKEKMGKLIINTPIIETESLEARVFAVIQYVLAFLGVVAVIVIIIGGYRWMTAAGNDEKVGKAKKTLIQGLIGLAIILLAYAIAAFVIIKLQTLGNVEKP